MAGNFAERISVVLSICGSIVSEIETFQTTNPNLIKFKVTFTDASRLHVSEDWRSETLYSYSYYWLDATNQLIIGWDDSKHHRRLPNFPHHKHVGTQTNREPSYETTLEQVLAFIKDRLTLTPSE